MQPRQQRIPRIVILIEAEITSLPLAWDRQAQKQSSDAYSAPPVAIVGVGMDGVLASCRAEPRRYLDGLTGVS